MNSAQNLAAKEESQKVFFFILIHVILTKKKCIKETVKFLINKSMYE